MPHRFPRSAFKSLFANASNPPLARLYSALVVIELGLKDHEFATANSSWPSNHDVPGLMSAFDSSLGLSLGNALASLYCTDRQGHCASVSANNYPHIRYLRHEDDFPSPELGSSNADIDAVLQLAAQCVSHLEGQGVI